MLTTIPDEERVQFLEASIATMNKAVEDAEGDHRELLELIIEEARKALKELKHRVWH